MKFYSTYYWKESASENSSLVLKHLVYHRGQIPVIFGAICMEEGEQVAAKSADTWIRQLTDWFYDEGLGLCTKAEDGIKALKQALNKIIVRTPKNLSIAGIICIDSLFLLFGRGAQRICLLNTGFGRTHCKELIQNGQAELITGKLQEKVGIMLASENFYRHVSEQQLEECLAVEHLGSASNAEKVKRHMKELGDAADRQGGQQLAALLLIAC